MNEKKTIEILIKEDIADGEIEIVQMLADNFRAKDIAEKTGKNKRTVEAIIAGLKKKYHARTPTGLVMIFMRNGLIS